MHTLAQYWVGEGEIRRGLSVSEGSLRDCNYGDVWTNCSQVCTAAPERRESVTLAVEGEARSAVLEVFNPTATTLGISVPYHL